MPGEPRITYSPRVVGYFPRGVHPELLLIGEAPGPRGADRTGYPFWGDNSGLDLYGLIESLGLLEEPLRRWRRGEDLSGTRPPAGRYAITNACPQMPLQEGQRFAAPEPRRLEQEASRLAEELRALEPRAILACGRPASFTLARASRLLGVEPPAPLAGSQAALKLGEAMAQLVGAEPWIVAGAPTFVTMHPSYGNWSLARPSGKLHAEVVARLRALLQRPQ